MSVVVLTGAGVSADSGIAVFRGAHGLWSGRRIEDVATPEGWARDPLQVWAFYQERRRKLAGVLPNAAHLALARFGGLLARARIPFLLVTQNVDDLHERAGSEPLHMHGELARLRCEACSHGIRDLEHVDPRETLACPACGHARMRPDVVWFGEVPYEMDRIAAAVARCTHFFSIGTSGVVYPAAGFLGLARQVGATTWVNSLDPPENLHGADRFLPGRAAEVVPGALEELAAELGIDPSQEAPS
jgi:NAD-dependent deacetylase